MWRPSSMTARILPMLKRGSSLLTPVRGLMLASDDRRVTASLLTPPCAVPRQTAPGVGPALRCVARDTSAALKRLMRTQPGIAALVLALSWGGGWLTVWLAREFR